MAYVGYLWLFAVSAVWLVRLLLDPTMVRRPLLEPNLTNGGLIFLGCSLFIFLMANVITSNLSPDDLRGAARRAGPDHWPRHHRPGTTRRKTIASTARASTCCTSCRAFPAPPSLAGGAMPLRSYMLVAKTMAISSHLAVVAALIVIGYWHFENIKMGIGAAALYLMLPYTAQMTGHVDHVLPAALLLWAIVFYRRPALAGIFLGLAAGVNYYPLFLLPLWISFYWQRGLRPLPAGHSAARSRCMVLSLVFVSKDLHSFWLKFQPMFALWIPATSDLQGHLGRRLGSVVSPAGHRRLRGARGWTGDLADAQESGHAAELLGRDDGRGAVLARLRRRRRNVHGLVPAAALDDRLPPEPGRPRRPHRARRRLVPPPPRPPLPARPRGLGPAGRLQSVQAKSPQPQPQEHHGREGHHDQPGSQAVPQHQ